MSLLKQFIEEKLGDYDKTFGTEEGTAGCDGCSANERVRTEGRELLSSTLKEFATLIQKEVEGMKVKCSEPDCDKGFHCEYYDYNGTLDFIIKLLDLTD